MDVAAPETIEQLHGTLLTDWKWKVRKIVEA